MVWWMKGCGKGATLEMGAEADVTGPLLSTAGRVRGAGGMHVCLGEVEKGAISGEGGFARYTLTPPLFLHASVVLHRVYPCYVMPHISSLERVHRTCGSDNRVLHKCLAPYSSRVICDSPVGVGGAGSLRGAWGRYYEISSWDLTLLVPGLFFTPQGTM